MDIIKVNKEYLKYYNVFQKPTNPGRNYPKLFRAAFNRLYEKLEEDYTERDYFDEEVISRILELNYLATIDKPLLEIIPIICDYFECKAICTNYIPIGQFIVSHTITVVGYRNDCLIAIRIIDCLVNGFIHTRINLQERYRKGRKRQRKRKSLSNNYINARTRASQRYYKELEYTKFLLTILLEHRKFGVVHNPKVKHLNKQIKSWFNLKYKYPNAHKHKIEHAMVKGKWVENQILKTELWKKI